jgi:PAS domain S-box-containing protein
MKNRINRGTVLLVDHDQKSMRPLVDILAAEGYQVHPAHSGQLALALVTVVSPDLILLNVKMPDMDGFELCRRLQSSTKNRRVPLLLLNPAENSEERREDLLGAADFISKPIRAEEALARVRTHMELGALRADLDKQVAVKTGELQTVIDRLRMELADYRRTDRALRESEERFRYMADSAPVIIWVTGPDEFATFFNKQASIFTGRSPEQLTCDGWADITHPEDLDRLYATLSSSVQTGCGFQMAFRLRQANGEYRWVLNTGVPRFAGGNYAGHIGTVIDITDLKRDHEQMLAGQKLESLGVLAAGIAHDFNNLLASIYGESDLALTEIPADSPAYESVQRIGAVAIRGAEIVNLLMAYAGCGGDKIERQPIDVSLLVEEMLQLLKVSISKKAVLRTSLARHLPATLASAPQLRQVVMNLIMNASEALEDREGFIMVTTREVHRNQSLTVDIPSDLAHGGHVCLEVSDTGCGMTEETKEKAFDPFYTTKFLGRGLGLAVVDGIIRSHGGAIRVESTPGSGSTFAIFLPCTEGQAEEKQRVNYATTPADFSAVSGTILLVEDEETLRLAVSRALQKRHFSVLAAADGHTAIHLFRMHSKDIDTVLLDITLPGISGCEVLGEIRQIKPETKVILTSAYDREAVGSIVGTGHSAPLFIRKPFHINELVCAIQGTFLNGTGSVFS